MTLPPLSIHLPHWARVMVLEWKSSNDFSSLKSLCGFQLPSGEKTGPRNIISQARHSPSPHCLLPILPHTNHRSSLQLSKTTGLSLHVLSIVSPVPPCPSQFSWIWPFSENPGRRVWRSIPEFLICWCYLSSPIGQGLGIVLYHVAQSLTRWVGQVSHKYLLVEWINKWTFPRIHNYPTF